MRRKVNNLQRKRIFFLGIVAFVTIFFTYLLGYKFYCLARDSFSHTLIPDRIVLSMHDFYSQDVKGEIEYFLWRELACDDGDSITPVFLCKTLKQNFKIISKGGWHQDSFGQAELIIYGTRPKFLLSNQFVVGNKRVLFSKDLFREYSLSSLKSLSVKSSFLHEKISHRLHQFLQKVPDWCWDEYTLSYLGPNKIFLDKTCLDKTCLDGESNGRKYRVITDEHLGITRPGLVEIPTLYDDCMRRKKIEKSSWFYRTRRFVCDTRFDGVMYTKFDYVKA